LSRPGREPLQPAGPEPQRPESRRPYSAPTASTSSWRFLAIGALILVGLVVWVHQSRAHTSSRSSQSSRLELHDVKVLVRGRLRLGDVSGAPRDARLTIHLPQIPLDLTRQGEQLKLSEEGDFQIEINFQSARRPARVEITASMPGYREEHLKDIPLQGDPLTAEVPPIVLKPR
ncbi:hypothetical protein DYH09_07600, partial [bacterium CPR1]|nr:hypothetical protein [bacterium CPR1]